MANENATLTRADAAEAPEKKGPKSKKDLPQVVGALLDTDHAAAQLRISRRTLQEKVEEREIACIKIGRAVRFHPDDIEAFIQKNRLQAVGWKGGSK